MLEMTRYTNRLRSLRRYQLLITISLIWLLILFLRQSFPPLFGAFKQEFGVTNTETGFLFSTLMFTYSVMQFPSGILSDWVGSRQVIILGALVLSLGSIVLAVSPTFAIFTGAAIVIGAGSGMHKTVAISLISNRYPGQQGSALGALDTIGQFGGVVAPATVVLLQSLSVHWGMLFIAAGFIGFALALFLFNFSPKPPDTSRNDDPTDSNNEQKSSVALSDYKGLVRDTNLLLFVVVISISTFIWNALSAFLPLYLMTAKGLTESTAGLIYSLFFVVSLGQLVTGNLSDRLDRRLLSMGLLLFVMLALSVLLQASSTIVIISLVTVIGLGFHGFRPVRDSYLTHLLPDTIVGGSLGIIRTIMTGMGSIGPLVVGYLSDTLGFTVAFAILSGLLGICLLMLYALKFLE